MSLIVIEGLDGSGKGTQSQLLYTAMQQSGRPCRKISFPNYESPSSALVKMYLAGEFGKQADSVNAYAASTFYAVDRYASFKKDWEAEYNAGSLILADRYTTSNMVYQLTKLPRGEWEPFLAWLSDLEYQKMGLPRPDCVLYLDMPVEVSQQLLTGRYQGDSAKKDIHEANVGFLQQCRESALYAAQKFGWTVIPCAREGSPLPREEIARAVLQKLKEVGIFLC